MTKLTKEDLFKKAQERFNSWAKMYNDPIVTAEHMYEDMSCSCYSGDINLDTEDEDMSCLCYSGDINLDTEDEHPVLDLDLCFSYRGYKFELSACNIITTKEQMLGLTNETFKQRFPHGVFTDRYVCWMYGHKDIEGHTQEESDEPEYWSPEIYLVQDAWSCGAGLDLHSGAKVDKYVLECIDKFLETFEE